jgi:hypothetical protein
MYVNTRICVCGQIKLESADSNNVKLRDWK